MRELLRVGLRFIMILFLVVGCVQNVYYMGELAKHNEYEYSRNVYPPIHYHDEEEKVEYVDTTETAEVAYPDYNRSVRAVRPY